MKYGVHLPNFGSFGDARVLAEMGIIAEQAGWDGFFIWDHVLYCEPDKKPLVDPWVGLTAVAMRTERILLGTLVTAIPRRRPWKLARETVSLQNLSGGRLVLGVGLGDPVEWEYRFFHEETDAKIRAEKLDEGLTILRGLWSGETFGFEGKHFQLEPMTFLPAPVKPIPIWVGGGLPKLRPFRRAARYDGVVPARYDGKFRVEDVGLVMETVRQHRTATGPFDVVIGGMVSVSAADTAMVKAFADAGAT